MGCPHIHQTEVQTPGRQLKLKGTTAVTFCLLVTLDLPILTQNTSLAVEDLKESVTHMVVRSVTMKCAAKESNCNQQQNLVHVGAPVGYRDPV